jgi:hypothetical protein
MSSEHLEHFTLLKSSLSSAGPGQSGHFIFI